MLPLLAVPKRLLLGRARPSSQSDDTLLPKRLALPVFASDPVSSVAYATQELLVILTLGGLAILSLAPWVAAAVCVVVAVVVVSYGQVVRAYPGGGGSYAVATRNLGPGPGLVAAGSLLVDYVLTVAVSVAAAVDNLVSVLPGLSVARLPLAALGVVLVMTVNLRGRREAGWSAMLPVYGFVLVIAALVVTGLARWAAGDAPVAPSAGYDVEARPDLTTIALVLIVLRSFAGGGAALAGVDAIANGVPAFRRPKARNASLTLLVVGALTVTLIAGVVALAVVSRVRVVRDACDLGGLPTDCDTFTQQTVLAQLAEAVFGAGSVGAWLVAVATVAVLLAAANSAFNGFPLLGAVLADDDHLPRQLARRGDRLAHSNGILTLATAAVVAVVIAGAAVGPLLDVYLVGLFTSFTLAQLGMTVHFRRQLRLSRRKSVWGARAGLALASVAAVMTALVLVVLLVTKVPNGAWTSVLAIVALVLLMRQIRRHYDAVSIEVTVDPDEPAETMPARVHAIVLVARLHRPALRAVAWARATRPSTIEAVTVAVDPSESRALSAQWAAQRVVVPLRVLQSPYREVSRPLVAHVRSLRAKGPRDAVTVFLPEYVVAHWWEALLHNQSNRWLRARLQAVPGVMVVSVPWQLASAEADGPLAARTAGDRSLLQEATRTGRADDQRAGAVGGT